MEIKIFLTIFCLLAFSLVNCYCSQYDGSNDKVTKFFARAYIVNVYNKELDDKIKWKDLNAAITDRDNMKDLRVTNADAYNNYVFGVQPIVNWCSSIIGSLNFVINKLDEGSEKLKFSIQNIEHALHNIIRLRYITAKDMEYKLGNDFEPEGYYGRRKADLRFTELKRIQEAAEVVKDGLVQEYREINSLNIKTLEAEPSDIELSEMDEEFSETLESLRVACVNYVQSHGVTFVDKRRRKRDMTSIAIDTSNSTHRMTFTAPLNTDENNFIIPQIEN